MRKILRLLAALMMLGCGVVGAAERVVFVDVQEVFKRFYKTQLAEDQIRQQADDIKVEMAEMEAEVEELKAEVEVLRKDARDVALSDDVRKSKRNELEETLVDLQAKEKEISDFERLRGDQIKQQNQRMTVKLLDEIQEAIILHARNEGYDAVVDRSSLSRSGRQSIMYVNPRVDITAQVLDKLNSGSEEYFVDEESETSEKEAE